MEVKQLFYADIQLMVNPNTESIPSCCRISNNRVVIQLGVRPAELKSALQFLIDHKARITSPQIHFDAVPLLPPTLAEKPIAFIPLPCEDIRVEAKAVAGRCPYTIDEVAARSLSLRPAGPFSCAGGNWIMKASWYQIFSRYFELKSQSVSVGTSEVQGYLACRPIPVAKVLRHLVPPLKLRCLSCNDIWEDLPPAFFLLDEIDSPVVDHLGACAHNRLNPFVFPVADAFDLPVWMRRQPVFAMAFAPDDHRVKFLQELAQFYV